MESLQGLANALACVAGITLFGLMMLYASVKDFRTGINDLVRTELAGAFEKHGKVVGWTTVTVAIFAVFAVTTDRLNRGIWTFGGIGLTILLMIPIVFIAAIAFGAYAIYKETEAQERII